EGVGAGQESARDRGDGPGRLGGRLHRRPDRRGELPESRARRGVSKRRSAGRRERRARRRGTKLSREDRAGRGGRHRRPAGLGRAAPAPGRSRASVAASGLVPPSPRWALVAALAGQFTTNQRRNPVKKSMSPRTALAGLLAVCFALPRLAYAGEPSDMDDVKRDLHQLQAQVQALRAAMSEAAELDRQRAAVLTRALKNLPAASESAAPFSSSKSEPAAPEPHPVAASAAPSLSEPRAEGAARGASHRSAANETSLGVLRGKVEVPAGEPVAYVYVENIVAPPAKGEHKTIQQSGKKFVPGWAVVQRGTSIEFPNRDNIYHNVFSLSAGNSFDLGLYNSSSEAKTHVFNEA